MTPGDASAPSPPPPRTLRARLLRALLGARPAALAWIVWPSLLGVALDVVTRHRAMREFPALEWVNYLGSTLVGLGVWGPLGWALAFAFAATASARRGARLAARVAVGVLAALLLPLAFFAYGAQAHYFGVFDAYVARDTLRLGLELRGTVGAYVSAWATHLAPALVLAIAVTAGLLASARRASSSLAAATPLVPALGFAVSLTCLALDFVATKGLQPAPPDVCFLHGVVSLGWDAMRGVGAPRGVSIRTPEPLPPLVAPAHRPNVLLVIGESLRADALCSERQPSCTSRFLDDALPERVALGRMTSQSSGTFTSCLTLWTGLSPDVDFRTAHRAPSLWEIARAVGYRTAYVASQNLRYRDLGAFLKVAGIDFELDAKDFGDAPDSHLGAPDERATEALVAFVRAEPGPWFAVLHLSNTHWPYRTDPALAPFAPHDPSPDDLEKMHNHYRNAVALEERTLAAAVRELVALPSWDDTVLVFTADHGEQFREHGALYHLNVLFDEEVRVPAFLAAGEHALGAEARANLRRYRDRRTFGQDVPATLLDAMGLLEVRAMLPLASEARGRSLLRAPTFAEPIVSMSTTSGVWWDADPVFGAMQGERKLVGGEATAWRCYDVRRDPRERLALPASACAGLLAPARAWYPQVPSPP